MNTLLDGMHADRCGFGGKAGVALGLLCLLILGGCSPDQILGSDTLPPNVPDPAHAKTPEGALAAYRGAVQQFAQAFGGGQGVLTATALLTDEMQDGQVGLIGTTGPFTQVDARVLTESSDPLSGSFLPQPFGGLQRSRGQIQEAMGALAAYAPGAPPALRGRLLAFEGYTEIFLADFFCSGIPLSTLDFEGDFTYQPGSSTAEVYERAAAHFDSALALAADSVELMHLAQVGKARALLALGQYDAAALTVAGVPDGFRYEIRYGVANSPAASFRDGNFAYDLGGGMLGDGWISGMMVSDREGINGLPYRSSGDPRSPTVLIGTDQYGQEHYVPAKYAPTGDSPIVLADGVEARLIQAEGQVQADDAEWLTTLNALRTDGTFDTQPDPVDTTQTDTLWHAGTGDVAGLAPLTDPGVPDARVELLFQERGYWLFLTAHRQGDLRRLVREYHRNPEQVYPTGPYAGLAGRYGTDVTAPIPAAERVANPLFHGCLNRGA
jgi:hypothetical protein